MIRLLQVITPLHVGEGSAVGAVDLPVARERHTGLPWLPGSSLKGALRERSAAAHDAERVQRVFGSEPGKTPLTRGTVFLGDGQLLALAVRCLQGGMALVSSPLVLARLARWVNGAPPIPTPPSAERVLAAEPDGFVVPDLDRVVLEDLPLLPSRSSAVGAWAAWLRQWVGEEAPLDRLVVVHDDVLAFACEAWLPVRTRAAIDEDGVVRQGHLFTSEDLPPESLLFVPIRGEAEGLLPGDGQLFVVGGHKTIGSGRVAWYGRTS